MNEEERIRIDQGSPPPVGETIALISVGLGVLALLGFIAVGIFA